MASGSVGLATAYAQRTRRERPNRVRLTAQCQTIAATTRKVLIQRATTQSRTAKPSQKIQHPSPGYHSPEHTKKAGFASIAESFPRNTPVSAVLGQGVCPDSVPVGNSGSPHINPFFTISYESHVPIMHGHNCHCHGLRCTCRDNAHYRARQRYYRPRCGPELGFSRSQPQAGTISLPILP